MANDLFPGADQAIDIKRLKAGELYNFRLLYRVYYDELVEDAKTKLAQKEIAAKLVRHCFIMCWCRFNRFSSLKYMLAFLIYTVRTQCDACNNNHACCSLNQDHILNALVTGTGMDGETNKSLFMTGELSSTELGTIREIFRLFYARSMTVEEIAGQLDLNCEDIQGRVELAFGILQQILIENA